MLGCRKYVDVVVVCDDGSEDKTSELAVHAGAKVIRHDRNGGKGEALRTLFAEARKSGADAAVTLDADGQHSPEDIPKVVAALSRADVVVGSRFLDGGADVPDHRKVVNKIFNAITFDGISDTQSGFRAYDRKAIEAIFPSEMGMSVDSEILMQARTKGLAIAEVPISVKYGEGKTSTQNPYFHALEVLAGIVKLSSMRHPLVFYGLSGIALMLAGIYYGIVTLLDISDVEVITPHMAANGFIALALFLAGLLAFFTGVILFTLSTTVRQRS